MWRLYWRWFGIPLMSVGALGLAVVFVVVGRTAFDYARSMERPTPEALAALPIFHRAAESLAAAAYNGVIRAPVAQHADLPTIELVADPEELSVLGPRQAKRAKTEVDGRLRAGRAWVPVTVALRGDNIFHWGAELRSYTVAFKRADAPAGQRELNLINPKDAAAFSMPFGEATARRLGVLAPDTQPCRLMLNGENQGVYFCQQPTNEAWLRTAGRPQGSVFVGDYLIYGYGEELAAARRLWDAPSLWKSETAHADEAAHRAALGELLHLWREIVTAPLESDGAVLRQRLERIADIDAFVRLWAVQTWSDSRHQDEFHNWRLYFNPAEGRFKPMVWDTLRAWSSSATAAIDAPLPRPQLALLRFPELNQRRYAVLYDELVRPERARHVAARWLHDYFARTKPTLLSAVGIDRMDWYPGVLTWVHVSRAEALDEADEAVTRLEAHARGLAALLEAVAVEDTVCAPLAAGLQCQATLASHAALEPVALASEDGRVALAGYVGGDGEPRLYPGAGAPARLYPRFTTAPAAGAPPRWTARIARDPQPFRLAAVAGRPFAIVWRNTLTGAERAVPVRLAARLPDGGEAAWSFRPSPEASRVRRIGPGLHTFRETIETREGQRLEIAAGARLVFAPGASLIARGPLIARGAPGRPVTFGPLDRRRGWGGIAVLGAGSAGSRIEGCRIDDGAVPSADRFRGTATLHVAGSSVFVLADCEIRGTRGGADAVHLSAVTGAVVRDVSVADAASDCVDFDYVEARVQGLTAARCGNDALDVGDSIVALTKARLGPARDKALSTAGASSARVGDSRLFGAEVGVLAKNGAQVFLDEATAFDGNRLDVYAYRKGHATDRGGCVVSAVVRDLNVNLEDESRLLRAPSLAAFDPAWTQRGREGPCWRR